MTEPTRRSAVPNGGELVPVDDLDAGQLPVVQYVQHQFEPEPDWMAARPPYNPNSAIEKLWSDIMVWPRRGARLFLLVTWTWWRAAITLGTLVLIWLVVTHG